MVNYVFNVTIEINVNINLGMYRIITYSKIYNSNSYFLINI